MSARGMVGLIVPERHERDVGLRLRVLTGCERVLDADQHSIEQRCKQAVELVDRRAMGRADRAHVHQPPFEQLDALALECTQLDQLVVFDAAQRSDWEIERIGHASTPTLAATGPPRPVELKVDQFLEGRATWLCTWLSRTC